MNLGDIIKKVRKDIPVGHHHIIFKYLREAYVRGVEDSRILIEEAIQVPAENVRDFVVIHEDDIDGG